MTEVWDTTVLEKPNWNEHIRHFFEPDPDVSCMASRGIDLATYFGVRLNADRIHFHVSRGTMPPDNSRRWSETKVDNFYKWMWAGYPQGEADFRIWQLVVNAPPRVRRSLSSYENDPNALDKLRRAFQGMMEKSVTDPSSYFMLASVHWLPAPAMYCRHHENAYNPWHRAYLIAFEDAMRTIEGCEDVTLPYWDIQSDNIPEFVWQEPFFAYKFPVDVRNHRGTILATEGQLTERLPREELLQRVRENRDSQIEGRTIDDYIRQALAAKRWQEFNGWSVLSTTHSGIIRAHDQGHAWCGTDERSASNRSVAIPNFAAFDPFFWFFHCNWDRLWWTWQLQNNAVEVEQFKALAATENDPTDWIDDKVLSMLQPFGVFTKDMINAQSWGIDYLPSIEDEMTLDRLWGLGSTTIHSSPVVADTNIISVRVKGINRLALPGSFYLELLANNIAVAETYVFQSDTPALCPSCTKTGLFSVDFHVNASEISSKKLEVRATCLTESGPRVFHASEIGEPTVNARILLNPDRR